MQSDKLEGGPEGWSSAAACCSHQVMLQHEGAGELDRIIALMDLDVVLFAIRVHDLDDQQELAGATTTRLQVV